MRTKADINITPLIDVLLVLIVIFMVITPLTPQGLEVSVPRDAAPGEASKAQNDEKLVLRLDRDGRVHLNQETLDAASLFARLREVFSTRGDRTIFVQASQDLLFNDIAQLIDVARGAGANRVGLLITPLNP